ncbi:MAG: hypothetical protein QXS68_07390 [Candidatus Methanomethylicaceae archaeon]
MKMPSGSVHDIRYLYTIVAAIGRKRGEMEYNDRALEYFRKAINEYNDAKSTAYGLSFKPREVNIKVVKDTVSELNALRIISKSDGRLKLTPMGADIASLIEGRKSDELRRVFTRLMLENYTIFEYFLRRLKEIADKSGLPVPFVTSEAFRKSGGEPKAMVESYIKIINEECPGAIHNPERLYEQIEKSQVQLLPSKTKRLKKLQAIIEKFVISEAFQMNIESRRAYDLIRSRTTFLGLTNYAIFDFNGYQAEVTYLTSDFEPTFKHHTEMIAYSNGRIFVNTPTLGEIREALKDCILKAYIRKKDELGYMKVADLRDTVCKELRISDSLFDMYIKSIYKEEPQLLTFTYRGAGDKITEKRLPIIFEKPMREFYTLVKVNFTAGEI